ncbi:hypothetical protein ACOI1H_18755, partial [Loktanella sp. DJP18]|uniref:hypothetical protein n=1 Tax=Loktanella sp. DJP18 TaxID=3409788 RepID=UPI003BB7AD17
MTSTPSTTCGMTSDLRDAWAQSEQRAPFHAGNWSDFASLADQETLVSTGPASAEGKTLILAFKRESHVHKFTVGERLLGSIRIPALRLANPWLADGHDPKVVA